MNKTEQAQQLRLATELIETEHPFEVCRSRHKEWFTPDPMTPLEWMPPEYEIRPVLATPPDGKPLHNPDNLTAEQVGLGYRLALQDESASRPHEVWTDGEWRVALEGDLAFINYGGTYRLPLSVPWPEAPKPDPYAALKAAHTAGKVIQVNAGTTNEPEWLDWDFEVSPEFSASLCDYRIKPEAPPFQLPPPPPGIKWHREDGWKAGDLPQGYRPLAEGEKALGGFYEAKFTCRADSWVEQVIDWDVPILDDLILRTTRPLVFTHERKEWTYHRPGDPMPCDGESIVEVLFGNGLVGGKSKACELHWRVENGKQLEDYHSIIGWHYAETTKQVPIGPEDLIPKLKEVIAMLESLTNKKA
jgi:hypothetical protein